MYTLTISKAYSFLDIWCVRYQPLATGYRDCVSTTAKKKKWRRTTHSQEENDYEEEEEQQVDAETSRDIYSVLRARELQVPKYATAYPDNLVHDSPE